MSVVSEAVKIRRARFSPEITRANSKARPHDGRRDLW